MWWNINRRLNTAVKIISPINTYSPEIVFILETAAGYDEIPNITGYQKFADENICKLNHGGIVVYVKYALASHVFNITFNECFISFRLDFVPHFMFVGAYIQPENSLYFQPNMFCALGDLLIDLNERSLIPILGGDINCRYGDLNSIFRNHVVHYAANVDVNSNHHGRTYGYDICSAGNIFPINHLKKGGEIST